MVSDSCNVTEPHVGVESLVLLVIFLDEKTCCGWLSDAAELAMSGTVKAYQFTSLYTCACLHM